MYKVLAPLWSALFDTMYGINCIHNNIILFQCHSSLQSDSVWSCYTLFDWKRFNLFASNTLTKNDLMLFVTELCFSRVFSMYQTHSIRDGEQDTIHRSLLLLNMCCWSLHQVPIECLYLLLDFCGDIVRVQAIKVADGTPAACGCCPVLTICIKVKQDGSLFLWP